MAHPVRPDEYQEINNFYTATVYEKGAEVIRMQHTLLGAERLSPRHGPVLRAPRRTGGHLRRVRAVDAGCVRRRPRRSSATGIRRPARRSSPCAAATTRAARTYVLDVEQSVPSAERQPPPSRRCTFRSPSGSSDPTAATCRCGSPASQRPAATTRDPRAHVGRAALRIRRRRRRAGAVAAARVLGAGASWSTTTTTKRSRCSRRTTATRSTAGMPRSARSPTRSCASRTRTAAALPLALPPLLARVVRQLLGDDASDPALLALALALPDAAYVASLEPVDRSGRDRRRDRVHRARARARAARRFRATRTVGIGPRGAYAPAPGQAGAAQPVEPVPALSGRARRRSPRMRSRREQFDAADNMTDSIARARRAARFAVAGARRRSIARFESEVARRAAGARQVVRAAGAAARATTRSRVVRALLAHPRFNARNPNRVRSLVGDVRAAQLRALQRDRRRGLRVRRRAGARARSRSIRSSRRRSPARSTCGGASPSRGARRCSAACERIARTRGLSPDVGEIVTRTLAR